MSEIAFIDAYPRRTDTGAEVTVRLAGGGTDMPYRRNNENYHAGVVAMPRFRAAFGFDDNGWTGGTVPTTGELGFAPGESALLTSLLAYYWRDAAISIDTGEESGPLARRLTGTVADVVANDGQALLTIADPSKRLDKPLLGAGFTGEGGIEGASEATGRAKRRSWGRVYNVEGGLLDKANNIYEFGDPSKPIGAFDAVRDKGRAGGLVVLPWQGSIAATFAALQAANAPEGGCVAAPSIACVKWWTVPAGPLTADIRGENTGGYTETAAGIVAKLLSAVDGPALADLAAAEALRPAPCGVHIAVSTDTVAQAIDRLLLGVSLFWVLQPDATIRIGEWAWGAPSASFQAIFLGRERQLPPVKSRKVGYRRNHRVHSDSEISAAVILADDVTYLDGTPLEDLKPAEGGAQSNRPPTDRSPAPPLELPAGTLWLRADGHPFRFGTRPWTGADGNAWTGADGEAWLGSGYADVQDQIGVEAIAAAQAVTEQVARIASDGWLTAGEKGGLVLSHKAMIENHIALDAKALALGVAATERTNATNAVNALNAYLTSLSPPWNDTTQDTEASSATITALWGDAAQKVALLQAAVQGLPGPQGPQGSQGPQGAQGVPGTDGIDGIDGTDGKLVEFVWKRAASVPATPTGNGIPAGWSDDPPAGSDPLWMSEAKQELDGTLVAGESWSMPIRHDGPKGADGAAGVDALDLSAAPASLVIPCNSIGVPVSGALPKTVQMKAQVAGADVTGAVAWPAATVTDCAVTNLGDGAYRVDTITAESASFTVSITHGGQTTVRTVTIAKARAGNDAQRAQTGSFGTPGSSFGVAAGSTITMNVFPSTTISLSTSASYDASTAGSCRIIGRLMYRNVTDGGSWTQAGSDINGSYANNTGGSEPELTPGAMGGGANVAAPAAMKSYEFRLEWVKDGFATISVAASSFAVSIS